MKRLVTTEAAFDACRMIVRKYLAAKGLEETASGVYVRDFAADMEIRPGRGSWDPGLLKTFSRIWGLEAQLPAWKAFERCAEFLAIELLLVRQQYSHDCIEQVRLAATNPEKSPFFEDWLALAESAADRIA